MLWNFGEDSGFSQPLKIILCSVIRDSKMFNHTWYVQNRRLKQFFNNFYGFDESECDRDIGCVML